MVLRDFKKYSKALPYKDIEKRLQSKLGRTRFYFAHPYSSWERGSNEHANGLIRFRIPKGKAIQSVSDITLQHSASMINSNKRKILGSISAHDLFKQECARVLH